jgi:hypothetical protein
VGVSTLRPGNAADPPDIYGRPPIATVQAGDDRDCWYADDHGGPQCYAEFLKGTDIEHRCLSTLLHAAGDRVVVIRNQMWSVSDDESDKLDSANRLMAAVRQRELSEQTHAPVAPSSKPGEPSYQEPSPHLAKRYVAPFYLDMMMGHAIASAPKLAPSIRSASSELAEVDVVAMLKGHWRPRVMGAWYATLKPGWAVASAVLDAVATTQGALDALALATAAVVLGGPYAARSLEIGHWNLPSDDADIADVFCAAALHIGAQGSPLCRLPMPSHGARQHFAELLKVVDVLRGP